MSRGQAGMGGMPGGARSGTGEGPLSASARRAAMRTIILGDFTSAANAMDQKSRGAFYTSEDRLRSLSAESARQAMESSASMIESNAHKLSLKFAQAGMAKDLLVMTIGAQREHGERVNAEIGAFLIAKPLTERSPEELVYLADKFGEMGITVGNGPDDLNAAISGFIGSTPSLDQMMKGGVSAPTFGLKH